MFILLLATTVTLMFVWMKWNFSYWQRKGFPYIEAKIPFGILDSVRRRERSSGMAIYDAYNSTSEKLLGVYMTLRPALLVRDAKIVRDMLVKDFNSFHDRGIYVDEVHDPLSGNLFALRGKTWKSMRVQLTPSFTSGKLKAMFDTVEDISEKMISHLNGVVGNEGPKSIEMKQVCTTYAVDIIASVIFGLDVNSFMDPTNDFYIISEKVNKPTVGDIVRGTAQFMYPNLEKIFVRLGWYEEAPQSMKKLVQKTIELREKHNITRKDMLQLLLQLRNSGEVNSDDNVWSSTAKADGLKHISVEAIAAQLFLFYVAGTDTTASTISFTLYELTQYPEMLAKAQQDVQEALEKHGKFCYDAVQDMKYLDLCVMETVRKYPALPFLNRECTQDFQVPDSNLVIKKGTPIIISLLGMHRDAAYFPDPLRYDPERYVNQDYDPVAYMPFGEGPRHCIAQRMGKVNAKVAIAKILTNFNLEPAPRREIEIDNFGIPIRPKGGVPVRLSKKQPASTGN